MPASKTIPCPICATRKVLVNKEGKPFSAISSTIARFSHIILPTGLLSILSDNTPVAVSSIVGDQCGACKGTRTVPDPTV